LPEHKENTRVSITEYLVGEQLRNAESLGQPRSEALHSMVESLARQTPNFLYTSHEVLIRGIRFPGAIAPNEAFVETMKWGEDGYPIRIGAQYIAARDQEGLSASIRQVRHENGLQECHNLLVHPDSVLVTENPYTMSQSYTHVGNFEGSDAPVTLYEYALGSTGHFTRALRRGLYEPPLHSRYVESPPEYTFDLVA
jgi:hypothetical protein